MSVDYVLDASALLALIHREPGAERVTGILPWSAISTVNLAEVFQSVLEHGLETDRISRRLESFGVTVDSPTLFDADRAAQLRFVTRSEGLSLGDRFCLALAERLGAVAVTADRAWVRSGHGITIELIR